MRTITRWSLILSGLIVGLVLGLVMGAELSILPIEHQKDHTGSAITKGREGLADSSWVGVATIMGNVALLIGVIVAVRHVNTLKTDRTAHIVVSLFESVRGLEEHLALLAVHKRSGGTIVPNNAPQDKSTLAFLAVANLLEVVAALICRDTLDLEIVDAAFGLDIFRTFYLDFTAPITEAHAENKDQYKWLIHLATDAGWRATIKKIRERPPEGGRSF